MSPKVSLSPLNGKKAQIKYCFGHEKGIILLVMNPKGIKPLSMTSQFHALNKQVVWTTFKAKQKPRKEGGCRGDLGWSQVWKAINKCNQLKQDGV